MVLAFNSLEGQSNSFIANPVRVFGMLLVIGCICTKRVAQHLSAFGRRNTRYILGHGSGLRWREWRSRAVFRPPKTLSSIPFMVLIPFFLMVFGFWGSFSGVRNYSSTFLLVNAQASTRFAAQSNYFELAAISKKAVGNSCGK